MNNHITISNNTDFVVVFNADKQRYNVYYKGKFLIYRERLVDVKSYLN